MFGEELKSVSVDALQEAIAKAVTGLVGARYTCNISSVEFTTLLGSKLSISLSPVNDLLNPPS